MFTENLPGLYGASFPLPKLPASPFHRAQHKWPAHTLAITLLHWKYIFVLFLRSVNSALFCSPSFKWNLIPSRLGGRSSLNLASLWLSFTIPACHRLSSVNEKSHSTCSTFHARRHEVYLQKSTASWADESLLFVLARPPPPNFLLLHTRAVNRPLSLRSPSSYRLKRGNHDSDPSSSILSSFLLNLSVL